MCHEAGRTLSSTTPGSSVKRADGPAARGGQECPPYERSHRLTQNSPAYTPAPDPGSAGSAARSATPAASAHFGEVFAVGELRVGVGFEQVEVALGGQAEVEAGVAGEAEEAVDALAEVGIVALEPFGQASWRRRGW